MVGRITASKDVLIPRTCNNVTLHAKWDFAYMIKIKDLEIGRLSWIIQIGPNQLHKSSRAENFPSLKGGNVTSKNGQRYKVAGFDEEGKQPCA